MNKYRRKISRYLKEFDEMVREDSDFCANTLYFGGAMIIILDFFPPEVAAGVAVFSFLVMILCVVTSMWNL